MRGGESLCRCHSGQKLHVFCTNEGDYCVTYVTALADETFRALLESALERTFPRRRAPPPAGG
jgi:hypothetical protein